jgi:hypothetical protein
VSEKHDKLLQELKPKDLERGLSKPECMEGTHQDILRIIDEWMDDFKAPNIYFVERFPRLRKVSYRLDFDRQTPGIPPARV